MEKDDGEGYGAVASPVHKGFGEEGEIRGQGESPIVQENPAGRENPEGNPSAGVPFRREESEGQEVVPKKEAGIEGKEKPMGPTIGRKRKRHQVGPVETDPQTIPIFVGPFRAIGQMERGSGDNAGLPDAEGYSHEGICLPKRKGYDCFKAMSLILPKVGCVGEGRDPGSMERRGWQIKKERAQSGQ